MAVLTTSKDKETVSTQTSAFTYLYDTTLDTDGGAWTKKCQNTSWYRHTGKDFPLIAMIEINGSTVKIYDVTKATPELYLTITKIMYWGGNFYRCAALNGLLVFTDNSGSNNHGIGALDMIRDMRVSYDYADGAPFINGGDVMYDYNNGLKERYSETPHPLFQGLYPAKDGPCGELDMCIHPDTPPHVDTGLPLPSIAWVSGPASGQNGVNVISPIKASTYPGGTGYYEAQAEVRSFQWSNSAYYFTGVKFAPNQKDIILAREYEVDDWQYLYVENWINSTGTDTKSQLILNGDPTYGPPVHRTTNDWGGSDPRQPVITDHEEGTFGIGGSQVGFSQVKWYGFNSANQMLVCNSMPQQDGYGGTKAAGYTTGWYSTETQFIWAPSRHTPSTIGYNTTVFNSGSAPDGYIVNATYDSTNDNIAFAQNSDTPRAMWTGLKPYTNYRLNYTISNISGSPSIAIDDDAGFASEATEAYQGTTGLTAGAKVIYFQSTRSNRLRIMNINGTAGSFTLGAYALYEMPTDVSGYISVANKSNSWSQTSIGGTYIQPEPVNNNTDLYCANLSSASTDGQIIIPYHADRQLGTVYTVSWWAKYGISQTWDMILSLGGDTVNTNHGAGIGFRNATDSRKLDVFNYPVNSGVTFTPPGSTVKRQYQWENWVVTCDGTNGTRVYVNGAECSRSGTNNVNLNLPSSSASYYWGAEGPTSYNSGTIDGREKYMTLLKMSKRFTSLQEAQWIYQQEKELFKPNAKFMLKSHMRNGSDYDPYTKTYHLPHGSDGSQSFKGLVMIDSDGTNCDTIQASNGIVLRRTS